MRKSPGQPITPTQLDLEPMNGFHSHGPWKRNERADAQATRMRSTVERLRKIHALAARNDMRKAHEELDELGLEMHNHSARMADLHLVDAGVRVPICNELAKFDIHTVKDLAHCEPTKLCKGMMILDVLSAALVSLRRGVEMEAG